MSEQAYKRRMEWLKDHKGLTNALIYIEKISELLVYVIYPLFLIFLLVKQRDYFVGSVLTCGISFVLVSLFRKKLNAKRPYEVFGFPAAMKKEKSGCSMPSRHVFSASIISVNLFFITPTFSLICAALSVIIALLRVLLGVHFVRDVLVGALIGIGFGILGSFIF